MNDLINKLTDRLRLGILRFWRNHTIRYVTIVIITGLIVIFIADFLSPFLPWKQPIEPNITSFPGPNPIVNTDSTQSVGVEGFPEFEPSYSNYIEVTIPNDNPRKCNMSLKLETSDGFKFLPISDNLPDNFTVEEKYEYENVMKIYIEGFPPKFSYKEIKFWVYTMDPDTYEGTEKISFKVLEISSKD